MNYKSVEQSFENEDYKITFVQPHRDTATRTYIAHDKHTDTESSLLIKIPEEECWNLDGYIKLSYTNEENQTQSLHAFRPKVDGRLMNTTIIGDKREKGADGFYHLNPSLQGLLSIYKGLRDGNFRTDIPRTAPTTPATEKEQETAQKILSFMDTYIFNTEESKEILNEYLNTHASKGQGVEEKPKESTSSFAKLKNLLSRSGR